MTDTCKNIVRPEKIKLKLFLITVASTLIPKEYHYHHYFGVKAKDLETAIKMVKSSSKFHPVNHYILETEEQI